MNSLNQKLKEVFALRYKWQVLTYLSIFDIERKIQGTILVEAFIVIYTM